MWAIALAEVPKPINYQGRLTDALGEPVADGSYNVVFTIYNDPTLSGGGNIVWSSGSQAVTTSNGLFSYLLGSNVAFPTDIVSDSARYLGIKVESDPEISPRTKFTSVMFAYHAATADGLSAAGDVWLDETGDELSGDLLFGASGNYGLIDIRPSAARLYLKTSGQNKAILYGDDFGSLVLSDMNNYGAAFLDANATDGGLFWLRNGNGEITARMEGTTSAGGLMALESAYSELRILATGGSDGGLQTWYNLNTPWISFEADLNGDASANFPDDAINSDEIKNEPGIVSDVNSNLVALTSTTMTDIATVTITIPSEGYILLTAKAWGYHGGTTGIARSRAQIDEASGGSSNYPYYTNWGASTYPTTANTYESIFTQRVYYKPAGTYTFRLEAAQAYTSTGAYHYIADPILVATYFSTSYGTVSTMVSSSESGEFDETEFTSSSRNIDGETEYTETNVKVDLSELYTRAEKLRKELRRTEMEIRDAERREQLKAGERSMTRNVND